MTTSEMPEEEFEEWVASFKNRPYEFVMSMFDWGVDGLDGQDGPDEWQKQFLIDLGEECEYRAFDGLHSVLPVLMSAGSGHGIGKSALVAWLILWLMSTRPFCRGTVTASTVTQLTTKTIPELAKWHERCLVGFWFRLDSMKMVAKAAPKAWRTDFQTARKENSEAFAGQHEVGSSSFYIFDESSGVPDVIWEVAEGGLTDGEPMWFAFGNRTKPTGRFNDCFGKQSHRWLNYTIDSRTAKMTNKQQIQRWAEDWGEDSDFFRVRVRGMAPAQAAEQLISAADVAAARKRHAVALIHEPLIMGIDVARYGSDRSVFAFRKGDDARTHESRIYRGISTMDLADNAAAFIRELQVDVVFVDGGGIGGGVVDRLRQLRFDNVIEVNFGGNSSDKEYYDKRTQMWGNLKMALQRNLAIEDNDELEEDLLCQDYYIDTRSRRTRMISKEDIHRLDGRSPDWADALSLTFSMDTAFMVADAGGAAGGLAAAKNREAWHPHDNVVPINTRRR